MVYDGRGNLIEFIEEIGSTFHTYNYQNQIINSNAPFLGSIDYMYDHAGQRIMRTYEALTEYTIDPNFSIINGDNQITVEAAGLTLATLDAGTLYYNHTDHLNSSAITTNQTGTTTEVIDYYPFGNQRIQTQTGSFESKDRFTGHDYDEETNLTYANARYLNTDIKRWMSVDPAAITNPSQFIIDPQQLNAYSYVRNNPLVFHDPQGAKLKDIPGMIQLIANASSGDQQARSEFQSTALAFSNSSKLAETALDHPVAGGAAVGVAGGLAAAAVSVGATAASAAYLGGAGTATIGGSTQVIKAPKNAQGSFSSFNAFKRAAGPADPTGQNLRQWHHIVEQNSSNISKFGQSPIQSGGNLVNIPTRIHQQITGHYNRSAQPGERFRDFVNNLSFEKQSQVGRKVLKDAVKKGKK
ncbi:MAG: RHS repeat-associated protein [Planctomycetota bacterium]|jgi:RHS repeat-associated protein